MRRPWSCLSRGATGDEVYPRFLVPHSQGPEIWWTIHKWIFKNRSCFFRLFATSRLINQQVHPSISLPILPGDSSKVKNSRPRPNSRNSSRAHLGWSAWILLWSSARGFGPGKRSKASNLGPGGLNIRQHDNVFSLLRYSISVGWFCQNVAWLVAVFRFHKQVLHL